MRTKTLTDGAALFLDGFPFFFRLEEQPPDVIQNHVTLLATGGIKGLSTFLIMAEFPVKTP
jgi:hypothetical protein